MFYSYFINKSKKKSKLTMLHFLSEKGIEELFLIYNLYTDI